MTNNDSVFETPWRFPSHDDLPDGDLVAIGADLAPGTLLHAYCSGLFPMPVEDNEVGWFWPEERGIFRMGDLRITKSMRRSAKRYRTTLNQDFEQVILACGDPNRPHGWINDKIVAAYVNLHELGVAHSIEVWDDEGLAGGLYGINVAGLFAGESMFHRRPDASKVALMALSEILWPSLQTFENTDPAADVVSGAPPPANTHILLDTQWATPHLTSLGAIEVDRSTYAKLLGQALDQPTPVALQ